MANAHEEINREPKNRIDNYQTITISQSGSLFYSVTNEIIQGVNNLNSNLSFIGRANVGLEKITDNSGNEKITTKNDYLYSNCPHEHLGYCYRVIQKRFEFKVSQFRLSYFYI